MFSLNSRKLLARATEKWPAKVLSVAAALILLVFHRMSTLESRFFSAPLRLETGGEFIPASSFNRTVRVTLRGDANSIFPIQEDDIEAYIDLKKVQAEGWQRLPVQIRKTSTALGVEPLEISVDPLEISLRLERKISRNIPITPVFQGAVAGGFELVSQSLSPAHINAEGPRGALESLSEFRTDYIDLHGRDGDFTVTVPILNHEPLIVIRGNGTAEFRGLVRRSVPVNSRSGGSGDGE